MPSVHDEKLNALIERVLQEASEVYSDPLESFPDYAALTLAIQDKPYDFTTAELKTIRDICRVIDATDEVAKNIQLHARNHVIGQGIALEIVPADLGEDPTELAKTKPDSKIKKMKENWHNFVELNSFNNKARNTYQRAKRDGEFFWRVFDTTEGPVLRFIEPSTVDSSDQNKSPMGITLKDPNDYESVVGYVVRINNKDVNVKAESVIHGKRNVDSDTLRGIPDNWPIITNFRRVQKLLVNVSALTSIQSAIALIRQHENSTQPRVQSLLNAQSDGRTRTDAVTGRSVTARKMNPGTILDAPKGVTYEFPAHSVNTENFIKVVDKELSHIALNHVLPVDWLLGKEPTDPLSPGSPVIANFRTEQAWFYEHVAKLFWMVQEMNGINVESVRPKYSILFFGPRLAVGKSIDEARVQQILQQMGAVGPQTVARIFGNNWFIERMGTIKHIETLQPGEIAPGSAGGTFASNNASNDGMTSKSTGTVKSSDSGGGTNKK